MSEKALKRIKIQDIVIPKVRANSRLTEEQLAWFKATVQKYGVLQPILVRELPDGKYELLAGKTRLTELKNQGAEYVDAIVIQADDKDALMMHLAENLARGQTDPISVAKVMQKALDSGATLEELAQITGHSKQWVKFYLSLLELPEVYQKALSEGKLTVTHIREALRLPTVEEIDAALSTALQLGWNAAVLKQYVENRLLEYQKAEEQYQSTGVYEPPPPPEPERLISYRQCMCCRKMVPTEKIRLPTICEDCFQLAQYCVSQLGDPRKAMETIYQALTHYQAFLNYQQQFFIQQQMQQTGYPPQGAIPEQNAPKRTQKPSQPPEE